MPEHSDATVTIRRITQRSAGAFYISLPSDLIRELSWANRYVYLETVGESIVMRAVPEAPPFRPVITTVPEGEPDAGAVKVVSGSGWGGK